MKYRNLFRLSVWENWLMQSPFAVILSDKTHVKMRFKLKMGKTLDLKNPRTFNEKLQWLKLYDRKPIYTTMVDKYEAKKFVADKIGEQYIIPTIGVWDKFDDIDFDLLPDQFVLKCTHDSGGLVICRDKTKLNKDEAKKKLEKSLKRNYFLIHREWPYKDVKRRIIAEKYMEDGSSDKYGPKGLTDYKFYCFNGVPKFLYLSKGLEDHATATISFLTLDWQFAPYERIDFAPLAELPPRPQNFNLMVDLAEKLSKDTHFLRVDLYEIDGRVYFSELTFSPGAGFTKFKNPDHDQEIGNLLSII